MRLVVVHSLYDSRSPSGENVVAEAQVQPRGAGHVVRLVAQRKDLWQQRPGYTLQAGWAFGRSQGLTPGGQTLVLGEALAARLPIVALPGSSAADVVSNLDVGAIVASDTGWAEAMAPVGEDDEVGRRARAAFVRFFRVDTWPATMLQVYEACQPR